MLTSDAPKVLKPEERAKYVCKSGHQPGHPSDVSLVKCDDNDGLISLRSCVPSKSRFPPCYYDIPLVCVAVFCLTANLTMKGMDRNATFGNDEEFDHIKKFTLKCVKGYELEDKTKFAITCINNYTNVVSDGKCIDPTATTTPPSTTLPPTSAAVFAPFGIAAVVAVALSVLLTG